MQQGRQSACAHVGTNALDHSSGGQGLTENRFGQLPAARRDHVALRAQPGAQGRNFFARIGSSAVDAPQIHGGHEVFPELRL